MRISALVADLALLVVLMTGCSTLESFGSGGKSTTPAATPGRIFSNSGTGNFLFTETDQTRNVPEEAHIVRQRFVTVRMELLLDGNGEARDVKELSINLFPDVIYTAVVEEVLQEGDSFSWSGFLEGVEYSYFTMVYTSGVYMGHFASPEGIYEVVVVEGDLYRVVMIDQTKFQGGEG